MMRRRGAADSGHTHTSTHTHTHTHTHTVFFAEDARVTPFSMLCEGTHTHTHTHYFINGFVKSFCRKYSALSLTLPCPPSRNSPKLSFTNTSGAAHSEACPPCALLERCKMAAKVPRFTQS
jgi:hypothetical protein